jgi:hypothetical protein
MNVRVKSILFQGFRSHERREVMLAGTGCAKAELALSSDRHKPYYTERTRPFLNDILSRKVWKGTRLHAATYDKHTMPYTRTHATPAIYVPTGFCLL